MTDRCQRARMDATLAERRVRQRPGPRPAARARRRRALKNGSGRHPAIGREEVRRQLLDARVVAEDLVVVELAPVRDDVLEPCDLRLERGDVLGGLQLGVVLDDGEQVAHGLGRRVRGRRLGRDRVRRPIGGPRLRDLLEDVTLERHHPAHGGDEVRQDVVALLERDVDVRPRLPDPVPEGDDRVVGRDDQEQQDEAEDGDGEQGGGGGGGHAGRPPRTMAPTIADAMASSGADEAEHEPALLACHGGLGGPFDDQQRRVLGRGDHEGVRGDVEAGRRLVGQPLRGEDRPIRPGIQLRLAHRPADPEPGDRRVAPGLLGGQQGAGGSGRGHRGGHLRILEPGERVGGAVHAVGAEGIRQVPERQRGPDDRHDVTGLQAGLLVVAAACSCLPGRCRRR